MTNSAKNGLKAMGVLGAITVVCVLILALCNEFFPKYTPKLDLATVGQINSICDLSVTDEVALNEGYIRLLSDSDYGGDLEKFNKDNKSVNATVLASYTVVKGDKKGYVIVEANSAGRDGDVSVLTAFDTNKIITGATVKSQNESYFFKLPTDLFSAIIGTNGSTNLSDLHSNTQATFTLNAISRDVQIAVKFCSQYGDSIADYAKK